MEVNHYIILMFLIVSQAICNLNPIESFEDIDFNTPIKFSVNSSVTANFKYKLGENKGKIGLKFLRANLYTVNIEVYDSEAKDNGIEYQLAKNQFKEIDVANFTDYVYIIIEQKDPHYYYDDYLTIYDSEKPIELLNNQVIQINNFFSDKGLKFFYRFNNSKNILLMYSTKNNGNYKNKLTITYNNTEKIINDDDTYKEKYIYIDNENITMTVEGQQEFSLIIQEIKNNDNNYNEILKNQINEINYIYNKAPQKYYFYSDITGLTNSNTFNIKLNYKYYNNNDKYKFTVLSEELELDNIISETDLNNHIPTHKNFQYNYDRFSDEYYRIYISKINKTKKHQYLLVLIEINDNEYYYGSRSLEISMGDEEQINDCTNIELNKLKKIPIQSLNYIPFYEQLNLNTNEKYLLYVENQYQFISELINGDLMKDAQTINKNYLDSDNELIVLSGIDDLTIRIFGQKKAVNFYIEKIDSNKLEYKEGTRNNSQVFILDMRADEEKYILGTYTYNDYAYGGLKVNYFATVESGNFELFYRNNISKEEQLDIFPSDNQYAVNFDELITLRTNLDLFKVKCKQDGVMYIRPQYKTFDITTHLLDENGYSEIHMSDLEEMVQLSAPIAKNNDSLYLLISIVNSEVLLTALNNEELKLTITPDTEGAFTERTIGKNELFNATINLSTYRPYQLAIKLKSNDYGADIEIVEVIHNKYTKYEEIKQGENKNINSNNVNFPVSTDDQKLYININNLKGKQISYGIIKSYFNDTDYITTADKYKNSFKEEINEDKKKIIIDNTYYNQTDENKPYIYFVFSILGKEDNLNYDIKIDFKDDENNNNNNPETDKAEDDDTVKIVVIVVIIVVIVLILGGIILFNVLSKRRRASSSIENLTSIESPN